MRERQKKKRPFLRAKREGSKDQVEVFLDRISAVE
jgi:hypothetical protein